MVPELWGKPLWEKVWPFSARGTLCVCAQRPRIGTSQGSMGPHGELFFFLVKKEPVVASNEVLPGPFVVNAPV